MIFGLNIKFIFSCALTSPGRLDIPAHMLPQTKHPTTLSVIHSESHTVINVLIDKVILLFQYIFAYLFSYPT